MNSRGVSQLLPFSGVCFTKELFYNTTVDALLKTRGHLVDNCS